MAGQGAPSCHQQGQVPVPQQLPRPGLLLESALETDSQAKEMASRRLTVFTQEELAEQARSVFASRARAVPPPARSAPLPAQQSPDHLCRLGSPHPGYHRATSQALAPPEGIPQDPPPLVCTKAASLLTSHCGAPGIPGESWDSAQPLGQHPRVLHTPRWRGGGACRARVIWRPLHNISPLSYTNEKGARGAGGMLLLMSWGRRGGWAPKGLSASISWGGCCCQSPKTSLRPKQRHPSQLWS